VNASFPVRIGECLHREARSPLEVQQVSDFADLLPSEASVENLLNLRSHLRIRNRSIRQPFCLDEGDHLIGE
jgi:hypothetical protein